MMIRKLAAIALGLPFATSHAALLGRAPLTSGGTDYQAYYDTVVDITWAADANLAASLVIADPYLMTNPCSFPDRFMCYGDAQAWASALNSSGYLGNSLWRLPKGLQPDPGCSVTYSEGSGGYGCTGGELGFMFYVNLGGTAGQNLPGRDGEDALFKNIMGTYWYGEPIPLGGGSCPSAWWFSMNSGFQNFQSQCAYAYAWFVSDGDIAPVPAPASVLLLGSALGVLNLLRRRAFA